MQTVHSSDMIAFRVKIKKATGERVTYFGGGVIRSIGFGPFVLPLQSEKGLILDPDARLLGVAFSIWVGELSTFGTQLYLWKKIEACQYSLMIDSGSVISVSCESWVTHEENWVVGSNSFGVKDEICVSFGSAWDLLGSSVQIKKYVEWSYLSKKKWLFHV